MGRGVSGCATCDGFFYRGQEVCVVGGGNTAVEEALYLSNIATQGAPDPPARQVPRRGDPGRQADGQGRRPARSSCTCGTTLDEVLGDASGVTGVRLSSTKDGAHRARSRCTGCFIAIGHQPNTDIFKGQLEMKDGYIVTKSGLERLGDDDQRAGRVRRRRRAGPRLPAGDHQRRHRLHGGARRPALPRAAGRADRRARL